MYDPREYVLSTGDGTGAGIGIGMGKGAGIGTGAGAGNTGAGRETEGVEEEDTIEDVEGVDVAMLEALALATILLTEVEGVTAGVLEDLDALEDRVRLRVMEADGEGVRLAALPNENTEPSSA